MSLIHANGFPANMAASRTPFFNAAWPRSKEYGAETTPTVTWSIYSENISLWDKNRRQISWASQSQTKHNKALFAPCYSCSYASYTARSVKIKSRRNCLCFVVIKPTRIFKPTIMHMTSATICLGYKKCLQMSAALWPLLLKTRGEKPRRLLPHGKVKRLLLVNIHVW